MAARQRSTFSVEGTDLTITNFDKVLFPEAGYTKGSVIQFYIQIAGHILPHLKNRPVTLKRYPDGIRAKHFYEKDAPKYTPGWVQTFMVPRRTGDPDIRYILINDLRTLVWCANLANIEIHPFLHRVPAIERPDQITFDLDPGEGTDLIDCAEVALLLRDVLANMKLQAFPKVSGSKGMQIAVPLNTAVTYEDTGTFAKALARYLTEQNPSRVVFEMAKEKRVGKVFVDWSQNSDFKTTVGVYSLRAKRAWPFVSMPVTWDEVETMRNDRRIEAWNFSPEDALKRVEKVGDLWAPVLKLKQKLPAPRFNAPPAKAKAPAARVEFVEPMQALAASKLPEGAGWQYEVKFDGYRTEAVCTKEGVQLMSRRANVMNERFAAVAKALAAAKPGTIFDGEVVAMDETGRPSFHALQNHRPDRLNLAYYVFDLLAYEGRDLTKTPLAERRRLLDTKAMVGLEAPVVLSPVLDAEPDVLLQAVREQGLEGVVAKRTSSMYEAGKRSGAWIKVRASHGQEFVAGGYKPGSKSFEYLLIGYYDGPKLLFVAKLKNGFTPKSRKEVEACFASLETSKCPFANLPEKPGARRGEAITTAVMPNLRWLRPKLVVQADFVDWTDGNHLRHAKFVGIRDDKDPRDVRKEI